ncbi:MAG: type II toxin-antitoxin system Phd/YefM family antitoxin [Spirochaetes bacterium]|nr:type II toxin-antitoxin system Phd/YefM family antitoxin [Spirochaetota bacterium]MBL7007150.1 type II toxin-antitoxin system Phd/YefM family antitoxin [Spirochaetia bacterium]
MIYTATTLRKSIYSVLDSVLESGIPAVIIRNGKRLKIVPEEPSGRLNRLTPHNIVKGNSEDLVNIHWDTLWEGKDFPE